MSSEHSKVRKVIATITLETTFESYGSNDIDEIAQEQIRGWIYETLDEEDNIPLFIKSNAGDATTSKTVSVKIDME